MDVLITGARGMLGTDVVHRLHPHFNVIACDIQELDIADNQAVSAYVGKLQPNIIINCAAYTNVDACETERDIAYKVNALGPRNLAVVAKNVGAKLVHISTDYVFDGETDVSYTENDSTNPLNVYGKSKLMGERMVRDLTDKFFIIRTQGLYGKNGGNFVKTMIKMGKERDKVTVVSDQIGSPTYTRDLAAAIEQLMATNNYGIYHVTNSGTVSWYTFTKTIYELAGIQTQVESCSSAQFPRPARRPRFSKLDNHFWRLNGYAPLRDYKEALRDYLIEMEKD